MNSPSSPAEPQRRARLIGQQRRRGARPAAPVELLADDHLAFDERVDAAHRQRRTDEQPAHGLEVSVAAELAAGSALDGGLQLDEAQSAASTALCLDDVGADGRVLMLGALGEASKPAGRERVDGLVGGQQAPPHATDEAVVADLLLLADHGRHHRAGIGVIGATARPADREHPVACLAYAQHMRGIKLRRLVAQGLAGLEIAADRQIRVGAP